MIMNSFRCWLGRSRAYLNKPYQRYVGVPVAKVQAKFGQADIAIFHQFVPPPTGGGHQFMRALSAEFERQNLKLEYNKISAATYACLFNSYNFDFERLRGLSHKNCKMVHRVDGPIDIYRGYAQGVDRRVWDINQELADSTVFQSKYSLDKHHELGLNFKDPIVIMNAVDPQIFYSTDRIPFSRNRKIRLISSSWSDNPRKGGPIYKWLDENLDWNRFEYTFVGRASEQFSYLQQIPPQPSFQLAHLLRQHDIFITASQNDPCSNALTEALSCGLPAVYFKSGGHPEIVGNGGLAFSDKEAIPRLLNRLIDEYEYRQKLISVPNLTDIAIQYLKVMNIGTMSDNMLDRT